MSLSADAKRRLVVALADEKVGTEVAGAIDSSGSGPAAVVANFGSTTNLTALAVTATSLSAAACSGGSTPSATNVNAAIDAVAAQIKTALDLKADNADAETLRTEVEARLDALEAKVNAVLTSLKNASLMATS